MQTTPKSMRLQIGIFGRTNVGKSSFLNMIAGQDVAVTSPVPGTTTDVVEKAMELLPIGPVVFLDTAGINDISVLSEERLKKTAAIFDRADVFVLLTEPGHWGDFEQRIVTESQKRSTPLITIVNKIDAATPSNSFLAKLNELGETIQCSSIDFENRNRYIDQFKKRLREALPSEFIQPPTLVGDLLPPGGLTILVVPIDLQAPRGRLILPQVQTIRDALDNDAASMVVKEREYTHMLAMLKKPPDLVVCDSQVVMKMIADTPASVSCTTFSILFARFKGDLCTLVEGAARIEHLAAGDSILIAESCTHHAAQDDIGRVKIPRWIRQYVGADLTFDVCSGRDYPHDLEKYKLIIHCGSCMLTRKEMLYRIHRAKQAGVPITNYGVAISYLQGVIERALSPFPAALDVLHRTLAENRKIETAFE